MAPGGGGRLAPSTGISGVHHTSLTAEGLSALGSAAHVERVAGLVALLRDGGFTLAALGDATADGRAVRGVKVSYKGQPDVELYGGALFQSLRRQGVRSPLTHGRARGAWQGG
jgi:hypothetical protein